MIAIVLSLLVAFATAAPTMTITEIVAGSADHTTLATALTALDLLDTFNGTTDYTVFAPSDAAFTAFMTANPGVIDLMNPDIPALTAIVQYHALAGSVSAMEAIAMNGESAATLNGAKVHINGRDGMVWVNGLEVVTPIDATNGWVHSIDASILVPPTQPASEPEMVSADLSTLQTLLGAASQGVRDALMATDATYTVFAPTNDAFVALEAAVPGVTACLTDPSKQSLLDTVLQHHVLGMGAYSGYLQSGDVTTLAQTTLAVTVDMSGVMVGSANVVTADVTLTNGVAHVVDAVLVPASFDYATDCVMMESSTKMTESMSDTGSSLVIASALLAL